ncbi:MAG TPA: DUF188 domain-containing protein [Firmicutes bacterium]|jgi:uncharacterized protein YaiI (UPF0178 family)|nr:DUF188 domain-containing protein [Bacillota bacterium]
MQKPQVIIDADACPKNVRRIIDRLQPEYGYELITVASFNHEIQGENHITLDDARDEADLVIANRAKAGDIVVTQDFGLAALVLAKDVKALSPKGMVYSSSNIDFLLEERYIKAAYRRRGRHTRGPAARTAEDDAKFETAFRRLLDADAR